jgi:preprotein translocase subunit YajC
MMAPNPTLVLRAEFASHPQNPDPSKAPVVSRDRSQPTDTAATQDPGGAPPKGQTAAPGDMCLQNMPLLIGFVAIFYFLIIRPSQKQEKARRAMLSAVQKGDRVVTSSGLHGTVTQLTDDKATLRVDKDIKLTFDRSAIGRVLDDQKSAEGGT